MIPEPCHKLATLQHDRIRILAPAWAFLPFPIPKSRYIYATVISALRNKRFKFLPFKFRLNKE